MRRLFSHNSVQQFNFTIITLKISTDKKKKLQCESLNYNKNVIIIIGLSTCFSSHLIIN